MMKWKSQFKISKPFFKYFISILILSIGFYQKANTLTNFIEIQSQSNHFSLDREDEDNLQDMEFYQDLLIHPMDLNNIKHEDLSKLPYLSDNDGKLMLDYLKKGPIMNIFDFTNVGISREVLEMIKPYTEIQPHLWVIR